MRIQKRKVIFVLFFSLLLTGISGLAIEKEESKEITRQQCIKEVMYAVGVLENNNLIISYYVIPFVDMYGYDLSGDDNYLVYAYENNITYGKKYISDQEAQRINSENREELKKALYSFKNEKGITEEFSVEFYTGEDGSLYNKESEWIPEGLFHLSLVSCGLYFCPEEIATMEECVAFFVRSMKDDEIYKDLDVTWQYAKEIGFIKDSDNLTPDTLLTRDILDTLLERFKNYEHRDLLK